MVAAIQSVSWSELKVFQRCPKQHEYKYVEGLVPKQKKRPLFLGNWLHACLESHYKQGDWQIGHQQYLNEYNKLFDEEKLELNKKGVLPVIVPQIMKSYLWYHRDDGWEVERVEEKFEVEYGGIIFKGRIDLIIRDADGERWVVDHKTTANIPEATAFHAMDPQLIIYPWAATVMLNLDVRGIIYNYLKSKAPTVPKINQDGSISRRKIVTDYPTLYRFLKSRNLDPHNFADALRPLRKRSPFLRRYRLPREEIVTQNILQDSLFTARRILNDEHRFRSITRDCSRMCSYHDLCRAELNGFNTDIMRRTNFTIREEDHIGGWDLVDGDEADEDEQDELD